MVVRQANDVRARSSLFVFCPWPWPRAFSGLVSQAALTCSEETGQCRTWAVT